MNYYVIPAALLIAFLLCLLFVALSPERRPFRFLFWFFLIIFLSGWAGQLWIFPFGPLVWGVAFLPLIFIAVIVALLIIAISPPMPPIKNDVPENTSVFALGMFFWLLLVILIVSIIVGYYRIPIV